MMTSISVRAPRRPCLSIRRIPIAQLHTTPIVAKKKKPWNSKSNSSPTPPPPQNSAPSNPPAQNTPPPSNPAQSTPPAPDSFNTTANSSSAQPAEEKKPDAYDSLLNDPKYKAYRGKQTQGVVTWPAVAIFLVVGTGMFFYFQYEKERMTRQRIAEENKAVGTPKVGGPYSLVDHFGKNVSQDTYKGKHTLIYFGFTRCPDICPEELDKMAEILDSVNGKGKGPVNIQPLFITCDPARDDPKSLQKYLAEYHPDIIGLTGSHDAIRQTCKHFRVYFSTPTDLKPGQDYLVDHSIFFYLMDPENNFVEPFGRNMSVEETTKRILGHISDWEKAHPDWKRGEAKQQG